MFFELRQYCIFPGKREQWVKFMEERIMPTQLAHGVVILGSFVGQEDEELYVWIRRFESQAHLEAFNAGYQSFAPCCPVVRDPSSHCAHLLTHTAGLSYRFTEPENGPYRRAGVSRGK